MLIVAGAFSPAYAEPLPETDAYSSSELPSITTENKRTLTITYKKHSLGSIDVYDYRGGYMLPLGELVKVLDLPIRVHPGDKLAQGEVQGRKFSLDVLGRTISFDGKQERYDGHLAIANKNDIYLDDSLLEQFFPTSFFVDPSALKLKITLKKSLAAEQKDALDELWKEQEEIVTIPVAKAVEYDPNQPPELLDENLLVLQPVISGIPLEDFVEAYQVGERYFLPLDTLMYLLDFPIEVDIINGTAEGWFIDDDHEFSFNMTEGKVESNGEDYEFSKADALIKDTDIFVDSKQIGKWFGMEMGVNYRSMMLLVESEEKLPFQKKMERDRKRERIEAQRSLREKKDYPLVDIPYKKVDWPFVDATITQDYRKEGNGDSRANTSYSIQSAGDLGYLNTRMFAAGSSENDALQTLRVKGERKDNSGNLLGGMHATQYAIGDIDSVKIPLASQTSLGRGAYVSNRPLELNTEFDSTNFIGDSQPGWDVELYRNETLLDFQTVGNDGRYQFLDVPVLFGNNTFRLVFYGPQGQIEEQVEQIVIDSAALRKGEMFYELSLDEKSKDLFGVDDNPLRHPNALRTVGSVEYGVTDDVSVRVGSVSTPIEDGVHTYLTSGVRTALGQVFAGADVAYDVGNGGWGTKFTALTGIEDVNIKLEQRFFDNFVSEERSPVVAQPDSQSELDVNSYLTLPIIKSISIGANVLYETLPGDIDRTTISNRISKSILGISVTNTIGATITTDDFIQGSFGLRGRLFGILVGGIANYRVTPERTIDSLNFSAQKNITRDVNLRLNYLKNLNLDERESVGGSLNWDFHKFRISAIAEADNNDAFYVGTTLNMSVGKIPGRKRLHVQGRPLSNNGIMMADAYLDKNYNNVFDGEDEKLEESSYFVDTRKVEAENGTAVNATLIADREISIELDPDSLEDPLWIPGIPGRNMIPRSGNVTLISFPVHATSEIDGTVTVVDDYGNALPIKYADIELIDEKGEVVQTVRTEYDGFYLFGKVMPGTYSLHVADKTLEKYSLSQESLEQVTIKGESDFYSGYDIALSRSEVFFGPYIDDGSGKSLAEKAAELPAEEENLEQVLPSGDEPLVQQEEGVTE